LVVESTVITFGFIPASRNIKVLGIDRIGLKTIISGAIEND
jgi:hypothetical protein